jgi:esterase/lipase
MCVHEFFRVYPLNGRPSERKISFKASTGFTSVLLLLILIETHFLNREEESTSMFHFERKSFPILAIAMLMALYAFSSPSQASATGGIDPADPMVRITSPPVDFDIDAVMAAVGKDVSKATGIKESFITYFWQTFDSMVYDGKKTEKPLFVDLYVPSFFSDDDVHGMMNAVADALVDHAGVDRKWLFIHTHFPLPGQVYISGGITNWDTYRGFPNNKPRDKSERALKKFLFNDSAFVFQCLWRFGLIASGGADLGELLTVTSQVEDFDKESWYKAWTDMAVKIRATAMEYAAAGHVLSAQQAYFRATTYFRASSIYLFDNDPRGEVAWQNGRDTFLKAAELSQGQITHVRIPYEGTTLPGYLLKPDNTDKKRPLLLIQTGLDGTAEDLYFIIGVHAVKRGYNCLIYEGPGQGEMIVKQNLPFRHDWEKVVTPVVDFALKLPETDPKRIAIIGYSMGGYLVPRALAYEKRIRWGIVDGGVYSVFDGTMTKFPDEVKTAMTGKGCNDTVNKLAAEEMEKHSDLDQFISQMLWTFQADTPCQLFEKLQKFTVSDSIGKIKTEMLVVCSSQDQIAGSAEQARKFFTALQTQKTYLEFDDSQGAQFHCQNGAPQASSERILNWLDERAKP